MRLHHTPVGSPPQWFCWHSASLSLQGLCVASSIHEWAVGDFHHDPLGSLSVITNALWSQGDLLSMQWQLSDAVGESCATITTELAKRRGKVGAHRGETNAQGFGNVLVGKSLAGQCRHFSFAR